MKPTLTQEQKDWLDKQLSNYSIIYAGFHGSWLYGLNTPKSDIDVKAIYLPSTKDLLRGDAVKTYNKKNEELDIEIEIKSLSSFLKSAESCDTNCVDLLHSPKNMSYITTPMWEDLCKYKACLYAKNMKGLIGYIKTHTHKYSNKIQRLEEMKHLLEECNLLDENSNVKEVVSHLEKKSVKYKFIKSVSIVSDHEQEYLEVCGKKYLVTSSIALLKNALVNEINRYGKRSNDGLGQGKDSKSLSHALRVLSQLEELISTRDIKFPLREKDHLLAVKKGEVELDVIYTDIDNRFDKVMSLLEDSDLPENVDLTDMYNILTKHYFN